ncbi:MAG TPA: ABC transporter substrate-binding protein [Acidimicrobiia bacterium]|nr:ABC transporter substrate-binding protein [Acidimicrobiia bacterium]
MVRQPRSLQARTLVVVLALSATAACAGEVGKYRDAAIAPLPGEAGGTATGAGPGAATASPIGEASETAVPTPVVVDTPASPGTPAITPTSGPAARIVGQGVAVSPGARTASGGSSGGSAPAAPTATAPGADSPAGRAAGGGTGSAPSTPTPAVSPSGGTTVGVTKDSVTVGLFFPKTGPYAGLFRNVTRVAQATFEEAGQIHGRRLVLKTYDDGTANASTIQAEEKRARSESFGLLSGVGESNVVLAPLADQHKVPLVIANIDEQVALPLTYVFAVSAYWRYQATVLPSFIKGQLGGGAKRIGVVYEGTSTAKNAKEAFKAKARESGLDLVFEQPIAQAQSACANEVANLQSRRVEVVVMLNGPLGASCMLRDARALGYKPTWTGVGLSWNLNVVAAASGGAADGIRTLSTAATLDSPAGRRFAAFARKYMANTGAEDDDVMLLAYGFIQSFIEGIRRTGPNLTREAFVQTFETKMNDYDGGFFPPPSFGPGKRLGPLVLGVTACCTNGKWTMPQPGWRAEF